MSWQMLEVGKCEINYSETGLPASSVVIWTFATFNPNMFGTNTRDDNATKKYMKNVLAYFAAIAHDAKFKEENKTLRQTLFGNICVQYQKGQGQALALKEDDFVKIQNVAKTILGYAKPQEKVRQWSSEKAAEKLGLEKIDCNNSYWMSILHTIARLATDFQKMEKVLIPERRKFSGKKPKELPALHQAFQGIDIKFEEKEKAKEKEKEGVTSEWGLGAIIKDNIDTIKFHSVSQMIGGTNKSLTERFSLRAPRGVNNKGIAALNHCVFVEIGENIHAESQLLSYIEHMKMAIIEKENFIGCSKKSCAHCHTALAALNEHRQEEGLVPLETGGYHDIPGRNTPTLPFFIGAYGLLSRYHEKLEAVTGQKATERIAMLPTPSPSGGSEASSTISSQEGREIEITGLDKEVMLRVLRDEQSIRHMEEILAEAKIRLQHKQIANQIIAELERLKRGGNDLYSTFNKMISDLKDVGNTVEKKVFVDSFLNAEDELNQIFIMSSDKVSSSMTLYQYLNRINDNADVTGVSSRNGKNRTLRILKWPQWPKSALFNFLVLSPNIIAS